MEKKNKGLTVEEVRRQAEITAKEIATQLLESIEHGFMTFPELIRILRYGLKKAIDEMCLFRPGDMPPIELKDIGFENLYKALSEIEQKETSEIKKHEKNQKKKIALP